jgi:hypothetical protein
MRRDTATTPISAVVTTTIETAVQLLMSAL